MTNSPIQTITASLGNQARVVGRMMSSEMLISDQNIVSMLIPLMQEQAKIEDESVAYEGVCKDLCESYGFDAGNRQGKPFVYQDGVAVIPAHGILVNRYTRCTGYMTGYEFLTAQRIAAQEDPDVKMIVYDVDTPGGEAAGCDECARGIYESQGKKPSIAVVNSLAASGGAWLMASMGRVIASPSSSVGNVGVYIFHTSIARMLKEFGIDTEYIKAGKFKTSGAMTDELSDEDRAYIQTLVDERYDEFVSAVAEFRGIDESVVRETEAKILRPKEALAIGLIDGIEAPAKAIQQFMSELGLAEPIIDEETDMATNIENKETAKAEITSEQRAEIAASAQADAKARIKSIVTSDEAKGREDLANHFAYDSEMSAAEAITALGKAPKAEAAPEAKPAEGEEAKPAEGEEAKPAEGEEAKGGNFEAAMNGGKHPEVGADGGDGKGGSEDRVAQILGAQSAATGIKFDLGQKQG